MKVSPQIHFIRIGHDSQIYVYKSKLAIAADLEVFCFFFFAVD